MLSPTSLKIRANALLSLELSKLSSPEKTLSTLHSLEYEALLKCKGKRENH